MLPAAIQYREITTNDEWLQLIYDQPWSDQTRRRKTAEFLQVLAAALFCATLHFRACRAVPEVPRQQEGGVGEREGGGAAMRDMYIYVCAGQGGA